MKFFGVVVVAIAILYVTLPNICANNSTWGYASPYDVILHREYVEKRSNWVLVATKDIVYPPKGYLGYYNISAIKAIDHDRKNGGYATLIRGGPGSRHATIHLKSQRGYGLNFTVEIYGRS